MDPDWQLLLSQLDEAKWGPLNQASHGTQFTPSNYYLVIRHLVTKLFRQIAAHDKGGGGDKIGQVEKKG